MMSGSNELVDRFGNPSFYEDYLRGIDRTTINTDFESLDANKGKSSIVDNYEVSRQNFLKLLGQHKMVWQPTNEEFDMNVDVSRIYRQDRSEYIAFMRIRPRGFRAERVVPSGVEYRFHLLMGRVAFAYRKKVKMMTRGQYITVRPKSIYSIRCCSPDEPAYLIFKIIQKRNNTNASKKVIVIE